jgi:acyl-CoA synthetase (AMP-forming)/AMP-acid ligase II
MDVFPSGSVWEFYGATEGPGTIIPPEEWLEKPGSVGRPWPGVTVKILDDEGRDCAPNAVGTIYLSTRGAPFRYHNAEEKTAAAFRGGFFTVGDMGYLDDDGYLFISDRKHDMIISGGVRRRGRRRHGTPRSALGRVRRRRRRAPPDVDARRGRPAGVVPRADGRLQGPAPSRARRRAAA